jgi:lipopolysaccharide transport system ATP-binding protein
MSSDVVIRAAGLGKCYHLYARPRDRLLQMLWPGRRQFYREFWALRGVSFVLRRGETLGVIGRNGSGKSTLLQIICGTLSPSCGDVEVNGRVAALLELGAGFNPEFTGRENVYMAARLYGLASAEIDSRFDRIAAFADIGDHLDQPVKTYSSGMYVRLAFAVIAHVDADVLVVDEALAVGDAVFTQKCMRFIRAFQERGTLLFVSHDAAAVRNLCRSAIWLQHGELKQIGSAQAITDEYLRFSLQEMYGGEVKLRETQVAAPISHIEEEQQLEGTQPAVDYQSVAAIVDNLPLANGWTTGRAEIVDVRLDRLDAGLDGVFAGGEKVRMTIRARAHQPLARPILGFMVRDRLGQDLFGENTLPVTSLAQAGVEAGREFEGQFVFRLPMLPNGQYSVMASVADGDLHENVQHHYLHDALLINVTSSKVRWGLVGIPFEKVSLT